MATFPKPTKASLCAPSKRSYPPRLIAALIIDQVIHAGKSLKQEFEKADNSTEPSLTKQLCFGVCRHYFQLKTILNQLLSKKIKTKDNVLKALLLSGLYELLYLHTAQYAVVSETVNSLKQLKKVWAKGLVNAVLRNFLRKKTELLQSSQEQLEVQYNHPNWLITRLKQAWPSNYKTILTQNNQRAPMILRVNLRVIKVVAYQQYLQERGFIAKVVPGLQAALHLENPCSVEQLPGFKQGYCSVQDIAVQKAVSYLQLLPGQKVLDACAAPGGKTAQMLEQIDNIDCLAIDIDPHRVKILKENLARLHLTAQVKTMDARCLDYGNFDRILLDAPCSATGIIRRHPDIKLLRQESDIPSLISMQRELLLQLWQRLAVGGKMLYATCSILPEENADNINWFLQEQLDAQEIQLHEFEQFHQSSQLGLQCLPGDANGDGFYYCLLQKLDLNSKSAG